jgi:hypothetical protein
MPYVFEETQAGEKISAYDFPSLTSEVLTETFAQAYEENPIEAVRRANELREAHQSGTWLDAATARQRLADRGMQSDITVSDAGITEDALNTLMFRKGIEKHRQEVFGLSEGGLDQGAARLGIALGTSLVDPLSIVTAFVPVVGQTRYGVMLGKAAGSLGRAGVRVGVGAVEGAAGEAILEPIIAGSRRYEQADYDMADSLMNVAFGGVFGAGLHSVGGAISDGVNAYYDARSQIPRGDLSGMDRVYETRFARQIDRNLSGAIRDYGKIEGSEGGKILNTDLASELSADYRADRTRSAAVHEPASYLVEQIYERRLAEPAQPNERVIFSGGGTGAGKTTGLDMLAKSNADIRDARIIYDTNLNGLQSSVKKIEQALASGRNVDIVYTYRHPVDALVNGVLPRAKRMGRTVPLEEHAKTHVGSLDTVRELSQKYADDSRVRIQVIDNSHGKGNARLSSVEALPRLDYNAVVGELDAALEAAYKSGAITDAIYRGTKGNGAPQRGGRSARQSVGRGPEQGGDGRGLGPEEQLIAATPIQRETALKQAVVNGALDTPINPQADAADVRGALDAAQKTLAREIDTGTPTADNLRAAQEEMSLAQSDLKALADRLGVEAEDASIREINEAAANADRWAKVANLATVCLVRGG